MSQLRKLAILEGLIQEQITLLRESYNARFDHLARSIAPETIAPVALWYDHFINLALVSIIRTTVNSEMDEERVPLTYTTYMIGRSCCVENQAMVELQCYLFTLRYIPATREHRRDPCMLFLSLIRHDCHRNWSNWNGLLLPSYVSTNCVKSSWALICRLSRTTLQSR